MEEEWVGNSKREEGKNISWVTHPVPAGLDCSRDKAAAATNSSTQKNPITGVLGPNTHVRTMINSVLLHSYTDFGTPVCD